MQKTIITVSAAIMLLSSCGNNQKAGFSGEDLTGKAFIARDKKSKKATFETNIEGKWKLYSGTSADAINFSEPILTENISGTFPLSINDSVRSYFQLVTEQGEAILSESILPMEGAYNFRDLGGIKTKEGKHVKWGKIFRADDLGHLTDSDISYLNNLPLTTVVDFRTSEEIKALPDRIPAFTRSHVLSISPGNLSSSSMQDLIAMSVTQLDTIMMDMNRLLVSEEVSIAQYKTFFKLLQDDENLPLAFHCSAGKDRTGMGAALFLHSLGVDEELIIENYLQSNIYLKDKYAQYINEHPNIKPLLSVKAEFLTAGLNEIKTKHGSVENYLTDVLEVDIAKMKELYLY